MHPWVLQPFPVPFPAPSLVGFITTNAILVIALMVLGLPIPLLRVVFLGPSFVTRRSAWKWFTLCLFVACAGLIALMRLGTFSELPIGFAWSTVYISGLSMLRWVKKPFNNGDHDF